MPERVVLGRRAPDTFAGFQWTGAEPDGMYRFEGVEELGAVWEGEELVTYDLEELRHRFEHGSDRWMSDSD